MRPMAKSLDWGSLLSYTTVTLCVIIQTIILAASKSTSTADAQSGLQVVSSASVIVSCTVRMLVLLYRPMKILRLCLFEIPDFLALLSAVLSFAAPATSAFALSLTASILTSINTALMWVLSIYNL